MLNKGHGQDGKRNWGLLLCLAAMIHVGFLAACGTQTSKVLSAPTATLTIRHRDVMVLLLTSQDLGAAYENADLRRLDRGKGWGEDTTRLSGYRVIYTSTEAVFSRVQCQVESYLTLSDAQAAYRAYHQQLVESLDAAERYDSVRESEERLLGDWNRKFTMTRLDGATELEYLFLRENVLVVLSFTGPDSPEFADQAARKARLLDERIFQR